MKESLSKKKVIVVTLLTSFLLLLFFHHALISLSLRALLAPYFSKALALHVDFDAFQLTHRGVALHRVKIADQFDLEIERVDLEFHFSLSPLKLTKSLRVIAPKLMLSDQGALPEIRIASLSKNSYDISIERGQLWKKERCLYFSFTSHEGRDSGILKLASEKKTKKNGTLKALIRKQEEGIECRVNFQTLSLDWLSHFIKPTQGPYIYDSLQGEMEGHLALQWRKENQDFSGHLEVRDFKLVRAGAQIGIERLVWQKGEALTEEGMPESTISCRTPYGDLKGYRTQLTLTAPLVERPWSISQIKGELQWDDLSHLAFEGLITRDQLATFLTADFQQESRDSFTGIVHLDQTLVASLRGHREEKGLITLTCESPTFNYDKMGYLFDFFPGSFLGKFHLTSGSLASRITLFFHDYQLKQVGIEASKCREMGVRFEQGHLHFERFSVKGTIDCQRPWDRSELQVNWDGGDVTFGSTCLRTGGQMRLASGAIEMAAIELATPGSQALLSLAGPLLEPIYQIEMITDGRVLLPWVDEEKRGKVEGLFADRYSFLAHGTLEPSQIKGQIQLGIKNEPSTFESHFLYVHDSEKRDDWKRGMTASFTGEQIDERFYGPLLCALQSETTLAGPINFEGDFNGTICRFLLGFSDLKFNTPQVAATIRSEKPALIEWNMSEASVKGGMEVLASDIALKEPALHFDDLKGYVKIDSPMIIMESFTAHFQSVAIQGKLRLELERGFEIQTDAIAGSTQAALAFLRSFESFHSWDFPLYGEIEGDENSFYLISNFHQSYWSLNLNIKKGSWAWNPWHELSDIKAQIQYDSNQSRLQVRNFDAELSLGHELSYRIEARLLEGLLSDQMRWNFDFRLAGLTHELIRLSGDLEEKQGWELRLNPQTQWFGEKIDLKRAHFDSHFMPQALSIETALNLSALYSQLDALSQADLISLDETLLGRVSGKLKLNLEGEEGSFKLDAKSEGFELNGEPHPLHFALSKEGERYEMDHLVFANSEVKGVWFERDTDWLIERIEWKAPGMALTAEEGVLNWRAKGLQLPIRDFYIKNWGVEAHFKGDLQGDFSKGMAATHIFGPFELTAHLDEKPHLYAKSQSPFRLNITPTGGINLDEISLEVTGGQGSASRIHLTRYKEIAIEDLTLTMKRDEIDPWVAILPLEGYPQWIKESLKSEEISLQGNLFSSKERLSFEGEIKSLHAIWKEFDVKVDHSDIKLDTLTHDLRLETSLLFCGIPLHVDIATRLLPHLPTEIALTNDLGEKLLLQGSCHEKLGLQIDRFFGEFFGLGVDLLANTKVQHPGVMGFTGYFHFNFNHFRDILPGSWHQVFDEWSLGRGYELSGDLVLFKDRLDHSYFKGFLKGRDFELKGYAIRTLLSEVHISSRQVDLNDFCISDEAGLITIPNMRFRQLEKKWQYSIPQIRVQDFRPSLLTDIYGQKSKLRPFSIRELVCDKLSGTFGEPEKATGEGKLVFINTFKRSQNLLDIPIDILGRIGLDAAILVPVMGEMTFEVSEGRVNFSQLLECFSEGRRSRFTLSKRKPSYLDFDGQFHIDIKMKQYVLLRFTQPFTLSIRGSLENPRFSLK